MAHQQPVLVTIQSPATASVAQPQIGGGYKTTAGKITGAIQFVCGSLLIILGTLANIFNSFTGFIGWPIWGGVVSMTFYFLI